MNGVLDPQSSAERALEHGEVNSELKLGLELLARHPVTLRLGMFFETWIATPSGTLRRSLGRDEYHLEVLIGQERPLAATGRIHICQVDLKEAGLGENQAREAVLVDAEIPPGLPVIWGIRTNRFLSFSALAENTLVRVVRGAGDRAVYPLEHPLINATEVAPGRYILEVTSLLAN